MNVLRASLWSLVSSFLLLLLLWGVTALGTTIRVPADRPTIQAGIDAAQDGDTVLIADGVYSGYGNVELDLRGKAIVVTSEGGARNCIIDGGFSARAFHLRRGEGLETVISGLTLRFGAAEQGGAVLLQGASPRFVDCVFRSNSAVDSGGAVQCESSNGVFERCRFESNAGGGNGGAIFCLESSPRIIDCWFENNFGDHGGGIYCGAGSAPRIIGSTFRSQAANYGGVLLIGPLASPVVSGCSFLLNIAGEGAAIYATLSTESRALIVGSRFSSNSAMHGGAIRAEAPLIIADCSFLLNTADGQGGAIHLSRSAPAVVNCLFVGNSAGDAGGAVDCTDASPSFTNCTFSGNQTDGVGGALRVSDSPGVSVTNSILWGNEPEEIAALEERVDARYSLVAGGWPGEGNLDGDPAFVSGVLRAAFRLSQLAAGEPVESIGVDAGIGSAGEVCYPLARGWVCLSRLTTRSDDVVDVDIVDLGYHHRPAQFATPTPPATPVPMPTWTPTPTASPTITPSPTGTPTPSPTPTPPLGPSPTFTKPPTFALSTIEEPLTAVGHGAIR
jgi:predicted outer membrane repeat protein